MFAINKPLLIALGSLVGASLMFMFGYSYGKHSVQEKVSTVQTKQIISNVTSNAKVNEALTVTKTQIVYKTKYIKEYIHDKENSAIDVNVDHYWVQLLDSAATSTDESATIPNDSGTDTKISRITTVVTDNYADCNYDKERLHQFQQWALANGFKVESD